MIEFARSLKFNLPVITNLTIASSIPLKAFTTAFSACSANLNALSAKSFNGDLSPPNPPKPLPPVPSPPSPSAPCSPLNSANYARSSLSCLFTLTLDLLLLGLSKIFSNLAISLSVFLIALPKPIPINSLNFSMASVINLIIFSNTR